MSVVRRADRRVHETPNAVMTTLASPTLGGAAQSLWQVRMRPGQAGPDHVMDVEQVWTVVDGGMTLRSADDETVLAAGDTAVLPAGSPRRIVADPDHGLSALVTGPGAGRALLPDGTDRGVPDWVR
ncbi:cupin domain-containing protein [Pseudonocardia kujensis]|uniref:cupin domain-containing protein n=1 Tax=Pseudonocardia kujensis TaxID=1128675 RepID=UPI001E5F3A56|nr:cupin domain-containing protein [Pseudonocardia kujensis]MCE0763900.1 cupin domain-containing protein [Pseudonocardia kujensis]